MEFSLHTAPALSHFHYAANPSCLHITVHINTCDLSPLHIAAILSCFHNAADPSRLHIAAVLSRFLNAVDTCKICDSVPVNIVEFNNSLLHAYGFALSYGLSVIRLG